MRLVRLDGVSLLDEIDQSAAVEADGKMGEHLLLFVRGERVLGEGAELVRVWMVPGLEDIVHLATGS
jgi:hypothetical protein